MFSLGYLHIIAFIIIFLNFQIFNKKFVRDLGSKYFMINYIYHNHKNISCFIISYPFVIILIYFLAENIIPVGTLFISVLHTYFLYEITSKKNIERREAYFYWYKQNVEHSLSMHSYDIFKKDYNFLEEEINKIALFKFEIIFFICLIIETEVIYEVISIFSKTN